MICCIGPGLTTGISAEEGLIISRIGQGSNPSGKGSAVNKYTGRSHLSQIFWENENLSSLNVIWLILSFIDISRN